MPERKPRPFAFGWEGDGGFGERLIQAILAGAKTATSAPAGDPEDAGVSAGDLLDLVDQSGASRGLLEATRVELRDFGSFDETLAACEGTNLRSLREGTRFANGRAIPDDEPMRVIYFRLVERKGP